ncbi:MAG: sensor histidine kinase [Phycisphaerales bacterium JB040]
MNAASDKTTSVPRSPGGGLLLAPMIQLVLVQVAAMGVMIWWSLDHHREGSVLPGSAWTPVGVAGVALLLAGSVFARGRGRCRAVERVSGAVFAYASGDRHVASLSVAPESGAIGAAWNALLEELEALRIERLERESADPEELRLAAVDAAASGLPIGLLVYESAESPVYENAAALHMRQALGLGAEADVEAPGASEVLGVIRGVCDGERSSRWSRVIEPSSGADSVLRVTVRPVGVQERRHAVVLIEDVTQQHHAEQARASFVARATHELRTPLTNIRLYADQAVELADDDPAEQARALNVINQESRRLERLVGDMLNSAEIESGSLSLRADDVRLDALLTDLRDDYQAQAKQRGIELVFDLPPRMPVLHADREKLALAMHNLVGNALKYTDKGGTVRVSCETEGDGSLRFRVADTGFGISPEDQPRLFDPYFRSGDERVRHVTGTGIGLSLARDVVRLHGGDISVESVLNEGSTFTMSIPGERVRQAA